MVGDAMVETTRNDLIEKVRAEQKNRLTKQFQIQADYLNRKVHQPYSSEEIEALSPFKGKEEEKTLTEKEVPGTLSYSRDSDILCLRFGFPDAEVEKSDVRANAVDFNLNKSNQVVAMFIIDFSSKFAPGNTLKFAIEQNKEAKVGLAYHKEDDVVEIRFSNRKPTDYVEDKEYFGIIKEYSGKELVGYLLVDFLKSSDIKPIERPILMFSR